MMDVIAQLTLIAGCAICAAMLYRQPIRLTSENKTFALLVTLSAGFIAIAAVANITVTSANQDSATMLRLFNNLKNFIALPLIASLILARSFDKAFTQATWGRWVLVLFALFELLRRSGAGDTYASTLQLLCILALLIAFTTTYFKTKNLSERTLSVTWLGLIATLCLGFGMCLLGPYSVTPLWQVSNLHALSLAIGLVILGLACGRWIRISQVDDESSHDQSK